MSEATSNERLPKTEFLAAINKLNRELATHATRKELKQGMALFEEAISKGWANSHTYAAAINCNVRCGNMAQAARLLEKLKAHGKGVKAEVIHYTTVMKGFCEMGDMPAARSVLEDMRIRRVAPNIRTYNTFLRGCMQTGCCLLAEKTVQAMTKEGCAPDVSSWEYLVVLLCQSLQLPKVYPIVGRLKVIREMQSGLSAMHVHMARAAVLLGEHKACRRSLAASLQAVAEDERITQQNAAQAPSPSAQDASACGASASGEASGGKRAWKEKDEQEGARERSLHLFREHKASELRQDIRLIEEFNEVAAKCGPSFLLPSFLRVLCLHTTAASEEGDSKDALVDRLAEALLLRLGLDGFLAKYHPGSNVDSVKPSVAITIPVSATTGSTTNDGESKNGKNKKKEKKAKKRACAEVAAAIEKSPLLSLPQTRVDLVKSVLRTYVSESGHFQFNKIFSDHSNHDIVKGLSHGSYSGKSMQKESEHEVFPSAGPLKLEICSGNGEWAVAQAKADVISRYVTLELRHDRVYQAFYRGICAQVPNLCTIAGDANLVVAKHFAADTFENVFVNHPEPPQQSGGTESEGRHLLTLDFFNAIAFVLKQGGMITVVTDNEWYAKFLLKLLANAPHPRSLSNVKISDSGDLKSYHEEGSFTIYRGKPSLSCGHSVGASSYFDRLWKRGNITDRYIIVLRKAAGDTSSLRIRQYKKGAAPQDVDASMPRAKKIKFDED